MKLWKIILPVIMAVLFTVYQVLAQGNTLTLTGIHTGRAYNEQGEEDLVVALEGTGWSSDAIIMLLIGPQPDADNWGNYILNIHRQGERFCIQLPDGEPNFIEENKAWVLLGNHEFLAKQDHVYITARVYQQGALRSSVSRHIEGYR